MITGAAVWALGQLEIARGGSVCDAQRTARRAELPDALPMKRCIAQETEVEREQTKAMVMEKTVKFLSVVHSSYSW